MKLGEICEKITDGTHHSPPNGPTGSYKYITAKNIKPWGLDLSDVTYVDESTHRAIYSRCDVRKNDVLYVKDGATTGRVAINTLDEEFSLLSSVGVLRPKREVLPKYLLYALQSPSVKDRMLADVAGVAMTRLTLTKLNNAEIPVATLEQQEQIVAEIEKQFSRLDEAVANLKRVKAGLKGYKAAVLKAAVEGHLVPNEAELARREGRSYESGAQLLQRILGTRRDRWNGRGSYKEPSKLDAADLSVLPEGWIWVSIDQITSRVADVDHKMPKRVDSGNSYISTKDFTGEEGIDFEGAKKISLTDFETLCRKVRPEAGDVLLSRYGTVGEVRIVTTDRPFQASYSIAIIKALKGIELAQYLALALRSKSMQDQIKQYVRATAQPDLGLAHIRVLAIPMPPLAEQQRIVAEVGRRFSVLQEIEAEVVANHRRAARLGQATLKAAFGGNAEGRKSHKDRVVEAHVDVSA